MNHHRTMNEDGVALMMKTRRDIPLSHLPLRPSVLDMLKICGFERVGEVWDSKKRGGIANLAAEWNDMELSQAHRIYREIVTALVSINESPLAAVTPAKSTTITAMELLQARHLQNQQSPESGPTNDSIITFSRAIDTMLAGGIALGEFTELAGAPGSGKTQMAMQLAVNAALPASAGGVDGSCIYIDTEGSFAPERCHILAQHLIAHIQGGMRKRNMPPWNVTAEEILADIHLFRVHTVADLIMVFEGGITKLLQQQQQQQNHKPVRLIVIDSFAFPYRADDGSDYVHRTRQLTMQICALTKLARVHRLAVLAINQMTTRLDGSLVPALGESWAHAVTTRLVLESEDESHNQQHPTRNRRCRLVKSPRLPTSCVEFHILEKGIRDIDQRKDCVQQPKRPRTN